MPRCKRCAAVLAIACNSARASPSNQTCGATRPGYTPLAPQAIPACAWYTHGCPTLPEYSMSFLSSQDISYA